MLSTTKAIKVVNQLRDEGVISKYAVGGAVGALFYIEPTQTQDIDIFINLGLKPGSSLVAVEPIMGRLKELGYTEWRVGNLVVEKWPVQFLPATKPVELAAIEHAVEKPLEEGVCISVPPPEYLMLIALDLCRPKDIIRLHQFHLEKVYNPEKWRTLLSQHDLAEKWNKIADLFKIQEDAHQPPKI